MMIVLSLTLYAYQTKYDYTTKGSVLIILIMILISFGFFTMFVNTNLNNIIYSCLGAFVFSLFIIYDTQMIIGGKHRKIQFRENDTILAATSLYLDIFNLFLYLLDIISGRN